MVVGGQGPRTCLPGPLPTPAPFPWTEDWTWSPPWLPWYSWTCTCPPTWTVTLGILAPLNSPLILRMMVAVDISISVACICLGRAFICLHRTDILYPPLAPSWWSRSCLAKGFSSRPLACPARCLCPCKNPVQDDSPKYLASIFLSLKRSQKIT